MELRTDQPIYFASDQHFGAPTPAESKQRERQFLDWLEYIHPKAGALFLLGDLFDFWFEYKKVVPKGFVRILGKLTNGRCRPAHLLFRRKPRFVDEGLFFVRIGNPRISSTTRIPTERHAFSHWPWRWLRAQRQGV